MTKEMFEEITAWQRETFPTATVYSKIRHLKQEVNGLKAEIFSEGDLIHEFADCFLLLLGAASAYGMGYGDICSAIKEKMEINRKRECRKMGR